MTWNNFDCASALERDILRRALPAIPSSGQSYSRVTYDPAATTHVAIGVQDSIGVTPEGCVEQLALRPLLTGAAWKVLDLLLEEALAQSGLTPDQSRGWSVQRKQQEAHKQTGKPAAIEPTAWSALTATYAATVELRHSLVHRRAHTDATGALVGVDAAGQSLRPLTTAEQTALARVVLTAADTVLATAPDSRMEARLLRHLADLTAVHGAAIAAAPIPDVIPEVTAILDPDPADSGRYPLDLPAIRASLPFPGTTHADIIVAPRDRPGQELHGHLEKAPDSLVTIDLDDPPKWLAKRM